MRIQHNIAAMNSYRNLGVNNTALGKNLEKLSSGYKINRAGDDAAGLAISEKMRAQITGLQKAQDNANDGIALVQTAEGALTEVHSMLNRMTELANQSANGTYQNEIDRENLQKEVASLKSEIDRISEATNFNGINLLDGSLGIEAGKSGAIADGQLESQIELVSGANSNFTTDGAKLVEEKQYTYVAKMTAATAAAGDNVKISFVADGKAHSITLTAPSATAADQLTAENIAKALNGDKNTALAFSDDVATQEALAAIRENFEITSAATGDGQNLTFKAKEAGAESATISSISYATAAGAAHASAKAEYVDASSQAGANQGYELTLDTTPATDGKFDYDETIKVGDLTFDVKKDETLQSLYEKMVDAGVKASYDATNKKITIDQESTMIKQSGIGIESSNEDIMLTADKASKAKYETTFAVTEVSKDLEATINYIDAEGNEKTAVLKYNSGADATATGKALKKAIEDNEELNDLFAVSETTGKLTLESKQAGADAARITGISTTDATATQLVDVTDGQDAGTVISLTGSNGATLASGANLKVGDTMVINGKTYEFTDGNVEVAAGNTAVNIGDEFEDTLKNLQTALEKDGIKSTLTAGTNKWEAKLEIADTAADVKGTNNGGLILQIGDTADDFNKLTVSVDSMHTTSLGIDDVDISTQDGASAAIQKIKDAINKVSSTRGDLGAIQNRLEHTINNLGVTEENMTSAESRIRDTDMAAEMMEYTKNNILIQASQAMLAQANQLPQGVLQLLG